MTTRLVAFVLLLCSCSSNGNSGENADTSVQAAPAGNSDGINTTGLDTAHIDTSLHNLSIDTAR
jgi:hypothetical protein